MGPDESALLDKAQAGDREALGRLLTAHQAACYSLALHLTGNSADAEDVCQDAFSRAIGHVDRTGAVQSARQWLLGIVVSAHRNRLGSETARRRRERGYAMERNAAEVAKPSGPERDELRRHLGASLRKLDEACRLPIVLHYEQGLSYAQAAAVLEMPEGTVATNIRRGLERLRELMARAGYGGAALGAGAVEAALAQAPAVSVPASLTAFVKSLAAGSTAAVTGKAAAAAGTLSLGWKLLAGLSLAATLGAGTFGAWKHWRPATAPAASRPDDETDDIVVTGRVLNQDGRPVPGVTVVLRTWEPFGSRTHTAVSDVKGDLRVALSPKVSYSELLRVRIPSANGLVVSEIQGARLRRSLASNSQQPQLTVGPDRRARLTIKLGPPRVWIKGLVTDDEGAPVAGAKLAVVPQLSVSARTDEEALASLLEEGQPFKGVSGANGRYEIGVVSGVYRMASASGPGNSLLYPDGRYNGCLVRASAVTDGSLDIRMHRGGALAITVRDEKGQPLPGATCSYTPRWASSGEELSAEADGAIAVPGLEPNAYSLRICPPKGSGLCPQDLTATVEAGKTTRLEAKLTPGAVLAGRVADEHGQPLVGITIMASRLREELGAGSTDFGADGITDGDGKYKIRGLPGGKYAVDFNSNLHPLLRYPDGRNYGGKRIDVVAGGEIQADLTVRQTPTATLSGRVTGPDGQPVAGAEVAAQMIVGQRLCSVFDGPPPTTTDRDGRYRIAGLLSCKARLRVYPPPTAALDGFQSSLTLKEGEDRQENVSLPSVTLVKLSVRDEAGQPLPGAVFTYVHYRPKEAPHGGHGETPFSDLEGNIYLRLSRPRAWGVEDAACLRLCTLPGERQPVPGKITLAPPGRPTLAQAIALAPGATLAGTVVDADGVPFAGAEVKLNVSARALDEWQHSDLTVTDRQGRFEFRNVAEGRFVLCVVPAHDERPLVLEDRTVVVQGNGKCVRPVVLLDALSERGLNALERDLHNGEPTVRAGTIEMLGRVGGEKAIEIFTKALASQDAQVRHAVIPALGRTGGDKVRDILLGQLATEKDRGVRGAIIGTLRAKFAGDQAVEKALRDLRPPNPTPKPRPRPQPKPEPVPKADPEVF